jgi:hypothetical protein
MDTGPCSYGSTVAPSTRVEAKQFPLELSTYFTDKQSGVISDRELEWHCERHNALIEFHELFNERGTVDTWLVQRSEMA